MGAQPTSSTRGPTPPVPAAYRATAVGVLNLLGASVSGFAPFLGGLTRRTIGVDQLMVLTGFLYLATAAIVFYCIRRHFSRDHARAAATASATSQRPENAHPGAVLKCRYSVVAL